MILTFEVEDDALHIHFDAEGRDYLVSELSAFEGAPDHSHIFMEPAGEISARRYDERGTAMQEVTLYMLDAEAQPAALLRTIASRIRGGVIEHVEYLGGVEQSSSVDEKLMRRVAERIMEQRMSLYERIFDAGCIKFGEFKLKSGIMSPVYCDFRGLISHPGLLREIGIALARKAKEIGCDRIAGIPYAGLPLGVAASITGEIPMIYPRKEAKDYGTKKLIEGVYNPGDKVLVIDDIITDGASKIEAIEPLKEAGLTVTDVLIILDREQGGDKILAKAGYTLHSLGRLSEVLDTLVKAGKVDAGMQARVAEFIAANQFA